jgi:hypothetical protein
MCEIQLPARHVRIVHNVKKFNVFMAGNHGNFFTSRYIEYPGTYHTYLSRSQLFCLSFHATRVKYYIATEIRDMALGRPFY